MSYDLSEESVKKFIFKMVHASQGMQAMNHGVMSNTLLVPVPPRV